MSSHLTLNLRLAGGLDAIDLRDAASFPYFTPMGVGGFADGKWILAGQGLEHFVYSFSQGRDRRKNLDFILAGNEDSARTTETQYLRSMANLARSGKCQHDQLSPNETLVDGIGTSFLHGVAIGTEDWDEVRRVLTKSKKWSLHIYGTFSVVARPYTGADWNASFRYVDDASADDSLPEPFVILRMGTTHLDDLYLQLYSQSTIWIDNMASLHGLVELADSHENLHRLCTGARHFLNQRFAVTDSELILSGSAYPYQNAFDAAFSGTVNRVSLT